MLVSFHSSCAVLVFICCHIILTASQGFVEKGDVVFLLDGSDSISDGEFLEQKRLIEHFIIQTDIGQDNVRVGAIVVSSDIGDTIEFSQSTYRNTLLKAVDALQQPQDGSRIDLGLNKLERLFFTSGRSNVPQIGIIVTDGRSKYPDASKGESEALKGVGIHLFCVGVGRLVDEKQLMAMAFKPSEYFYITPFEQSIERLLRAVRSLTVHQQKVVTTKMTVPTTTTTATTTTTTIATTKITTTTKPTTTTPKPKITKYRRNGSRRINEANTDGQMKISVKSNLLNGKDTAGTKVETFVGGDTPWWNHPSNKDTYQIGAIDTYQEPTASYQNSGWYQQTAHIEAPWVQMPEPKQTQAPWKTSPTKVPEYQVYRYTTNNPRPTPSDSWSGDYRNPLNSPVTLFSINSNPENYQTKPMPIPQAASERDSRPISYENREFIPRNQGDENQNFRDEPTMPTRVTTAKPTTPAPTKHIVKTQRTGVPGKTGSHTDKVEEEHLCFGSQYVDGVGYNADPKSCNEFIQCFYEGGQIKVERARCPFRMFWDQRLLLCRPSTSMSCWRDPCFDFTVRSYDHKGNCRAHWSCRNGLSQAKCCPMGFAFAEDKQECIPDPNCNDWCEDDGELTFTSPFASCRMTPFETNERFYYEEIPGLGMMTRSCPRGSQYNPGLCTCDRSDEVRKETCRPELILDFQDGFNDKSGNNLAVTPENVHVENGAARFDGSGKIRLWRFAGVSYGSQFAVTMKYKESPHHTSAEPEHLLSNCFNPEVMRPSIDIAISPNKGAMFLAATDKGGEQMSILKYNSTEWKTLSFVYDGNNLIGNIDGRRTQVPLRGTIEERPSALVLGACDYFGGFHGLMDDVKLYLCVPHGIT